jgi:biotin carboxyl carrier protein
LKYFVTVNQRPHEVELVERLGRLEVRVDGKPVDLSYDEVDALGQVIVLRNGKSFALSIDGNPERVSVTLAGHFYDIGIEDERERAAHAAERAAGKGGGAVTAVMPGVVVEVMVKPGDRVQKGQPLLILSAMKMQNEIAAPSDAVVKQVLVASGQAVASGAKLLLLEAAE